MINADNFIEGGNLFLRNLNATSKNVEKGTWISGTGYAIYNINYEIPVDETHYYYQRCVYKYTTTNQNPTWCTMYIQGGMTGGSGVNLSKANTEYTISGIGRSKNQVISTTYYGQIYNGPSTSLSGVTSYVKDVLIYDVTELYHILLRKGDVSDTATLATWCLRNLDYVPNGVNYDISSIINSTSTKISIKNGKIVHNQMIECDGMRFYSVNTGLRDNSYFDSNTPISVYNNAGNGSVTHVRGLASSFGQDAPFKDHPYILKITTNGTASPYAGGFVAYHNSKANGIFIEKFVAKVPVGYSVTCHYNSQGSGSTVSFITSNAGTGKWEEYAVLYKCGTSGTFSSGGHIALNGPNNQSVTWYLAYINNCDITEKEYLKNYSVLQKTDRIKDGNLYSREFNESGVYINNWDSPQGYSLPASVTWQRGNQINTNTGYSICQNVGAGPVMLPCKLAIDPSIKYKISYWVKCKGDMTSFLTGITPYYNDIQLNHSNVIYVTGTYTSLSQDLKPGDTQVFAASNANWVQRSYSRVGFRSNKYYLSYNNLGRSNGYSDTSGLISGVTGSNIINLKIPYTGSTIKAGNYIVESYDGANYPYPIQKANLPTDNTWKYVEGTFGNNTLWDGSSNGGWQGLPFQTTHITIYLNLYKNDGSVPIYYSDIKIEPITLSSGHRKDNKIQIPIG